MKPHHINTCNNASYPPHSQSGKITQRQSNLEILRIIAMFLILVVHADYFALGIPSDADLAESAVSTSTRVLIEFIAIIAVNVFVALSGWFLIKPSLKGFSKFLFQCLYFFVGIYLVSLATGYTTLSLKGIAYCLFLTKWNWFIKAYIGLYILSPVLNAFIERAPKKQLEYFLIAFYAFQTVYTLNGAAPFIANGYSTFSFIGIYILARYARLYLSGYSKLHVYIAAAIVPILLNSIVDIFSLYTGILSINTLCMSYTNPLTIISAISCVIMFSRLNIGYNKTINFISASSFAVFLLHGNPNIVDDFFCAPIRTLFDEYDGVICLLSIFIFLITVFATAIILDQPRKWLWNKLQILLFDK